MPDHVRGRLYSGPPTRPSAGNPRPGPAPRITVEPTHAGDQHVHLWTWDHDTGEHAGVLLNSEQTEQLGIDLQIRASYMRGVKPPPGPEPDRTPGPDDVPLIPDNEQETPHEQ